MRRGRYCRVSTCPNFIGAKKSTPMFNAPAYDPPLRDKWIRWLRLVEPKFDERLVGFNFTLCDLHFDTDDMRRSGDRHRLMPGTIPKYFISHPDPLAPGQSESGDDLKLEKTTTNPQQNSEVVFDKNKTSNVSEKQKRASYCKKCIDVNVDVQSLKVKLSKSENRIMNQKSIMDSLRNMLSQLKSAQKSEIPKTDVCSICNKKLPTGSLYEHLCIETEDEDGTIKCAYCARLFKSTIALTEHLKFSHLIKSHAVSCDECDQHYAMKELLQVHVMAKHKRNSSKLTPIQSVDVRTSLPIPMNGTQSIELESDNAKEMEPFEMNIERPRENLECHQTPKRMKSSTYSGYSYSYLSDGNDMASNEHCNETITTTQVTEKPQLRRIKIIKKKNTIESTNVSEHLPFEGETIKITVEPLPIPLHDDNPLLKPYECGHSCGERFAQPQELNMHMRQNHRINGNGIQLECYQCHERFIRITDLRNHLSTFHEMFKDKSRLCDQCGRICKTKKQMEMHYKSHTTKTTAPPKRIRSLNGNPYCDICKILFNCSATYWRHSLKHRPDGGKKYACDQCPMRFIDRRQLIDHTGKHTGEKPFQCDHCDPKKLFRYKESLRDHLRTHFGDKIYGCQVQDCDERFQFHRELQEHLKNSHN